MAAPVTAIVAYDTQFYELLPRLFPHADARAWFVDKPDFAEASAFRNSSLQGAYFIIAARALGLPVPLAERKEEGAHATAWLLPAEPAPIPMGPDLFCDGQRFAP